MSHTRPSRIKHREGFTFIELIIVVLLLGILSAVAVPGLAASMTNARLYAACSEVSTALRFAQLCASNSGRSCRVTIQLGVSSIKVEQLVNPKTADILNTANTQMTAADIESAPQYVVVKYPMKPRTDYDLKIKDDSRFPGAKIDLGQTIVYDGTGAPSAGGQIIVSYGGRLGILTVDAVTGKVTRTQ